MWGLLAITQVLLLLRCCIAQSSGFAPAAIPHALRSPYLNAWLDVSNKGSPLTQWPTDVGFDGHVCRLRDFYQARLLIFLSLMDRSSEWPYFFGWTEALMVWLGVRDLSPVQLPP
jgi:hypothetical protein